MRRKIKGIWMLFFKERLEKGTTLDKNQGVRKTKTGRCALLKRANWSLYKE
jgi:hypothetical protein